MYEEITLYGLNIRLYGAVKSRCFMPLILLIIGLVLIVYSYRAIRLEHKNEQDDESAKISFRSVLEDNKEELNDYKMEIGILRRDIAESLTELQEEILGIKNDINLFKNIGIVYDNKKELDENNLLDAENENHRNYDRTNDNENPESKLESNGIEKVDDDGLSYLMVEDGVKSEIDFSQKFDSNKTQRIKNLLNKGLTEEEICHELSISKGEVLLVKGLFKK